MTIYGYVDPQGRVCAFCHTPHYAAQDGGEYLPLWSRIGDTKQFNVAYNSTSINAISLKDASTDKGTDRPAFVLAATTAPLLLTSTTGLRAMLHLLPTTTFPPSVRVPESLRGLSDS